MIRVIPAPYDPLIPFDLRSQIFKVDVKLYKNFNLLLINYDSQDI